MVTVVPRGSRPRYLSSQMNPLNVQLHVALVVEALAAAAAEVVLHLLVNHPKMEDKITVLPKLKYTNLKSN